VSVLLADINLYSDSLSESNALFILNVPTLTVRFRKRTMNRNHVIKPFFFRVLTVTVTFECIFYTVNMTTVTDRFRKQEQLMNISKSRDKTLLLFDQLTRRTHGAIKNIKKRQKEPPPSRKDAAHP
jgi:hypothetical protein